MSTIGRTNSGSGGGFNVNKPLIHVNTLAGSTVNFSVSGIIVKTIPPEKSILNQDGITADYYYVPRNAGTYTISGTYSGKYAVTTITVSDAEEYDVSLSYGFYYVLNGIIPSSVTFTKLTSPGSGQWTPSADLTQEDGYSSMYIYRGWGYYVAQINTSNYKTLWFDAAIVDAPSWLYIGFSTDTAWRDNNATNFVAYKKFTAAYARTTDSIDLTNVNGNYYFKVMAWGTNGTYFNMYNIWLEEN